MLVLRSVHPKRLGEKGKKDRAGPCPLSSCFLGIPIKLMGRSLLFPLIGMVTVKVKDAQWCPTL